MQELKVQHNHETESLLADAVAAKEVLERVTQGLDVDAVVAKSLKDFEKGKPISVPGMQYKFLSLIAQYLPRPLVRKLSVASRR